MGTYAQCGWDRERELRWCADHGRFTPFGGETVPSSARTPIAQVVRELELLHATYLNSSYHRGTLEGWRKAAYRGGTGFEHIERRLGYRLVADRLRITKAVDAGGTLRVELDLRNVGFASPLMPREVAFVLSQGDRTHRVALTDADPRRWTPEAGTVSLRGAIPIPADARGGRWRLALQLADPSPSLSGDGRYAIRLANEGITFDEADGSERPGRGRGNGRAVSSNPSRGPFQDDRGGVQLRERVAAPVESPDSPIVNLATRFFTATADFKRYVQEGRSLPSKSWLEGAKEPVQNNFANLL